VLDERGIFSNVTGELEVLEGVRRMYDGRFGGSWDCGPMEEVGEETLFADIVNCLVVDLRM
jgi:hypothetical protein